MTEDDELGRLGRATPPEPSREGRARALAAARAAFDEKNAPETKGSAAGGRLIAGILKFWREAMSA